MRSILKSASAALSVCILLTQSGCATVKVHPEFNDRHATMQRIAVLPPDTQVYEVTFNAGNKPLPELTEIARKHTSGALTKTLETKGYDVVALSVEQKDLDNDPALKEAIFNIQTLYKQATEDIAKNKKPSFTYDLGSSANYFAERDKVNALIITRQVGNRLSDGSIAADVASTTASIVTAALLGVSAGGGMRSKYTLLTEIAVVDADLGDILWYHLGQTNENFTKAEDPKPIEKIIETIMGAFPASKVRPPAKDQKSESKPATTKDTAAGSGQNFAAKKPSAAAVR
ncbi:MAG: hypothetical protein MOGMAGMI_02157 [Candidatus Omnitrophica bacterium]|nr:hypothetical protein [Candidatus Omnitrophota bacterium]